MESKKMEPMILMGRNFTAEELELIKKIVELYPNLSRAELSKTICCEYNYYNSFDSYYFYILLLLIHIYVMGER